jgi:hypothetical protein
MPTAVPPESVHANPSLIKDPMVSGYRYLLYSLYSYQIIGNEERIGTPKSTSES